MSGRKRVLFICTANSCRSQMAEGIARHSHGALLEAYSAGSQPTSVHPLAIKVMAEVGIDVSNQRSKSVNEFAGQEFDYVISLCSDLGGETCPVFPGGARDSLHWGLRDPAGAKGSEEEVLPVFRQVRDQIRAKLGEFVNELRQEEVIS